MKGVLHRAQKVSEMEGKGGYQSSIRCFWDLIRNARLLKGREPRAISVKMMLI